MRKLMITFLAFTLAFGILAPTNLHAGDPVNITINGVHLNFEVPPQIINDRTMLPLRAIGEALGMTVLHDPVANTAILTQGEITIIHEIGTAVITVNGVASEFDVPSMLVESRTLVPVRMLAEAIGADVEWTQDTRTVVVDTLGSGAGTTTATTQATEPIPMPTPEPQTTPVPQTSQEATSQSTTVLCCTQLDSMVLHRILSSPFGEFCEIEYLNWRGVQTELARPGVGFGDGLELPRVPIELFNQETNFTLGVQTRLFRDDGVGFVISHGDNIAWFDMVHPERGIPGTGISGGLHLLREPLIHGTMADFNRHLSERERGFSPLDESMITWVRDTIAWMDEHRRDFNERNPPSYP